MYQAKSTLADVSPSDFDAVIFSGSYINHDVSNTKYAFDPVLQKQAEQFCLGLQRQGLTVSISPDEDFDGGHSGGGI